MQGSSGLHDQAEFENSAQEVQSGRKSWAYVTAKVPTFAWELGEGINHFKLKADTMPASLKEGQQKWCFDLASGGRNRVRVDFPLHLLGEIGYW